MFTFNIVYIIYIICVFINLFLLREINGLIKKINSEKIFISFFLGIVISLFSFFLTFFLIIIYFYYYKKVYKDKWLKFIENKKSIKIKNINIHLIIYKIYYKLDKWFKIE